MQCARCKHENRPGARFCEECAAPLARACANCGAQLSPSAKFCSECAHPAGQAAVARFAAAAGPQPGDGAHNFTLERTAGSHSLAAVAQRARYADTVTG